MKCKFRPELECDIFIDVNNCWYDKYWECLQMKMVRDKREYETKDL